MVTITESLCSNIYVPRFYVSRCNRGTIPVRGTNYDSFENEYR